MYLKRFLKSKYNITYEVFKKNSQIYHLSYRVYCNKGGPEDDVNIEFVLGKK